MAVQIRKQEDGKSKVKGFLTLTEAIVYIANKTGESAKNIGESLAKTKVFHTPKCSFKLL